MASAQNTPVTLDDLVAQATEIAATDPARFMEPMEVDDMWKDTLPFSERLMAEPLFDVYARGETQAIMPACPMCTIKHPEHKALPMPKMKTYYLCTTHNYRVDMAVLGYLLTPGIVKGTVPRQLNGHTLQLPQVNCFGLVHKGCVVKAKNADAKHLSMSYCLAYCANPGSKWHGTLYQRCMCTSNGLMYQVTTDLARTPQPSVAWLHETLHPSQIVKAGEKTAKPPAEIDMTLFE